MSKTFKECVRFGHIPLLIVLQLLFIILFAVFVDYDPITAVSHQGGAKYDTKWQKGDPIKGRLLEDKQLGTSTQHAQMEMNKSAGIRPMTPMA